MSELNRKIQEYISRSRVTIYQLAKNTNLDRTMIQKMIKGSKYPGGQFFSKFCDALMLNKDEKEELIRLFRIEKAGSGKYYSRMAIAELLAMFKDKEWKFGVLEESFAAPYDQMSDSGSSAYEISGNHSILLTITSFIREAMQNLEKPEIWFDTSRMAEFIIQYVYLMHREFDREAMLRHHVLLSCEAQNDESRPEELNALKTIVPALFTFGDSYQVYHSYVRSASESDKYIPFRHYLLAGDKLLLFNADGNHGLVITEPALVKGWQNELLDIRAKSSETFKYTKFLSKETAQQLMELSKNRLVASYETTPSPVFLLEGISGNFGADNEMFRFMKQYESNIAGDMREEGHIHIFGLDGLPEFVRSGRFPGTCGKYLPLFSEKDRKKMIRAYASWLKESNTGYLMRDNNLSGASGVKVELYAPNIVVIGWIQDEYPVGILVIEETIAFNCFLDYFKSMIEYEEVYMPDESAERLLYTAEQLGYSS